MAFRRHQLALRLLFVGGVTFALGLLLLLVRLVMAAAHAAWIITAAGAVLLGIGLLLWPRRW